MSTAFGNRKHVTGSLFIACGLLVAALAMAALLLEARSANDDGPAAATLVAAGPSAEVSGVVSFWEARVASDPADFVAHNKLAQAYLRRARETGDVADYSRAEAAVSASLEASPQDNFIATALLASIQNTRHEFAAAAATAEQAIAIDPGDPYGYAVLGDAQLALGFYDEAQANYEHIVATSPGLTSFSRLAHVLELRGEIDSADLAWQNALSTDGGRLPENTAWARVQYADFQFRLGRLENAEANYNAALQTLPGYVHAIAGLAKLSASDGDFAEAAALYETVVQRQPLPEYAAALGDVYTASGDAEAAQRQYDLVLAIAELYGANGIDTDLQTALFFADHALNLDEAVRQARAVYGATPDSIYAADALAWSLHRSGRTSEALPYVHQALRLNTPDPQLLFHAGVISLAAGDTPAARDYLTRAQDLNPRFSALHAPEFATALAEAGVGR